MASEYNFYLVPMIQGPITVGELYWPDMCRPIIFDEMNGKVGEEYHDMMHPQRRKSFLCAKAEPARHQYFQTLTGVTRILPFVSLSMEQIRTNLDKPLSDLLNATQIAEMKAAVEACGVSTSWATTSTTFRDVVRYIARQYCFAGSLEYGGDVAKAFLTANLDANVSTISAAARNKISSWMTEHGLDSSWIVGTTKVRAVLHYIFQHFTFGKILFMGEEF